MEPEVLTDGPGNAGWKYATTVMVSVLFTLGVSWVTSDIDPVDRITVASMIDDKTEVYMLRVDQLNANILALTEAVESIRKEAPMRIENSERIRALEKDLIRIELKLDARVK